jgi:hypothetical protein
MRAAAARPMPRLAPVTNATRPSNRRPGGGAVSVEVTVEA